VTIDHGEAAVGKWRTGWAGGLATLPPRDSASSRLCLLALAACGRPAGVVGNLTNNWPTFAEPTVPVAVVGECQAGVVDAWSDHDPPRVVVNCSDSHTLDVVYVGHFSASASAGKTVPARDSADSRAAFAECDRAARDYVGGDWHTGRLFLHYSPPTAPRWEGGDRFFSCSLSETKSAGGLPRSRTGTVKDALRGDQPLALRCFNQVGIEDSTGFYTKIDDIPPVDCGQPHTMSVSRTPWSTPGRTSCPTGRSPSRTPSGSNWAAPGASRSSPAFWGCHWPASVNGRRSGT
jgi:hypothetical protein